MRRSALLAVAALLAAAGPAGAVERLDGFNVIAAPAHPYGSTTAQASLFAVRRIGAKAIAVVPFLWQRNAGDPDVIRGSDLDDAELRLAIRDAHALGLKAIVKPHVWVQGSWAGAIAPRKPDVWFARYRDELVRIAKVASQEGADVFAIGTELEKISAAPQWTEVIAAVRAVYRGPITYIAHNVDEAEAVPFWRALDMVGVSLYPPLGPDGDRIGRLAAMTEMARRLDLVAARAGKPLIVGEIGVRSAVGAAAKPWESAEEREAAPDPVLQADVLADWLTVLDRPAVRGVLVWRWFTDPMAGGPADTDFTVQGKAAQQLIACKWAATCD